MEKENNDKGELIDRAAWFTRLTFSKLIFRSEIQTQAYSIKFGFIFLRSAENKPRRVTYDISIRGCAYEGSNPDPKIWVHQNRIPEF